MFKLVGSETFELHDGKVKCEIVIHASYGLSYDYTLLVNGKQLRKFKESQVKLMKTWTFTEDNKQFRVVLGKCFTYYFFLFSSSTVYMCDSQHVLLFLDMHLTNEIYNNLTL